MLCIHLYTFVCISKTIVYKRLTKSNNHVKNFEVKNFFVIIPIKLYLRIAKLNTVEQNIIFEEVILAISARNS